MTQVQQDSILQESVFAMRAERMTLDAVADKLGISRDDVRRYETAAHRARRVVTPGRKLKEYLD